MFTLNQEFYNAVKESVQMSQQRWVEWRHEMTGLLHCGPCLSLHKCWFLFEKGPVSPLHDSGNPGVTGQEQRCCK